MPNRISNEGAWSFLYYNNTNSFGANSPPRAELIEDESWLKLVLLGWGVDDGVQREKTTV